jgi:hypothetical protein
VEAPVTLVLVPANVLIVNDIKLFLKKLAGHMDESPTTILTQGDSRVLF